MGASATFEIKLLLRRIRAEAKKCLSVKGDSMLHYTEPNNLAAFKWKAFELELKRNAPFIYEVLEALTTTPKRRKNQTSIICICAAIMLKHRHSNMSLIHKLISCILFCGHCSKEVYTLMCIVLYIIYVSDHVMCHVGLKICSSL